MDSHLPSILAACVVESVHIFLYTKDNNNHDAGLPSSESFPTRTLPLPMALVDEGKHIAAI